MKNNIIFDFGGVLIDWNPHYLYDPYFGDSAKAQWFLDNICNMEWNVQMDAGKPFAEGIKERTAQFPEWEKEIQMYFTKWHDMIGEAIPGMYELLLLLKEKGYKLWGLSNWSMETFVQVEHDFPALDLLDGKVVSGNEGVIKPSAAIYNLLLERFSLKADECVFVDDNYNNIKGAEAVGIEGILFTNAAALKEKLLG